MEVVRIEAKIFWILNTEYDYTLEGQGEGKYENKIYKYQSVYSMSSCNIGVVFLKILSKAILQSGVFFHHEN